MKKTKKIVSFLLLMSVLLCICGCTTSPVIENAKEELQEKQREAEEALKKSNEYFSARTFRENDCEYYLEDMTASLVSCNVTGQTVVLPAEVDGFPLVRIEEDAFLSCTSLNEIKVDENNTYFCSENGVLFSKDKKTLVKFPGQSQTVDYVIPEGVEKIAGNAFYNCDRLQSVVVPDGVTTIGESAFYSCELLTRMELPDSAVTLGKSVFEYCKNMESINIPRGITQLPENMLYRCEKLTSITIPDGVTTIGTAAFYGCVGLTELVVPDSVKEIGMTTFAHCESLEKITVSKGIKVLPYGTFQGCYSLQSVELPDTLTTVGQYAFNDCQLLFDFVLPDSVTSIGDYAFRGCFCMLYMYVPKNVTTIGTHAFLGCGNIEKALEEEFFMMNCDDVTIYCEKGSYADSYAMENGIAVEYLE